MIVYLITNKVNGKKYVGKTQQKTLPGRWRTHAFSARRGSRCYFHIAIRKYGAEAWTKEIIGRYETKAEMDAAEVAAIRAYRSNERMYGYNMTCGGDGSTGWKHSEESKRKISESLKGNKRTLGHTYGPETLKKRSEAFKGNKFGLGIVKSAETRQKLSAALKGRTLTQEHRLKIAVARRGANCPPPLLLDRLISQVRAELSRE